MARPITEDLGVRLDSIKIEDLGQAKKVTIDKDNTTIVEGAGTSAAIDGRVKQMSAQVEDTTSDYDREKLQERLAKLVGGVAIIKVGAATETEMKEKKARVEDAMHATKAAVEEGIVAGGGVALLRARRRLTVSRSLATSRSASRSLPCDRGADATDRGECRRTKERSWSNGQGNERRRRFQRANRALRGPGRGRCDRPDESGPIALQNAASIASLLLTTEAVISVIPEKHQSAAPSMGGMDGGMY